MAHHRLEYDDLYEMVRAADSTDGNWKQTYDRASRTVGDKDWSGADTYRDARALALDGWDEGVKRLTDLRDQLIDDLSRTLPIPAISHDTHGFAPDVGAFVVGDPEDMLTWTTRMGSRRQHHIVMNFGVHCGITTDAMILRGLLVAGLVDALEYLGHRCRVDAVLFVSSSDTLTVLTHIKRENEVLDLERLTFACAHPAMLRRLGLGVMETLPPEVHRRIGIPGGYGRPGNDPKTYLDEDERGDIYIGNTQAPANMLAVYQEVLGYLRKAGIIPEEEVEA